MTELTPDIRNHIDPNTGRIKGDHGTHQDAVEYILDVQQAPGEETEFLQAWSDGTAYEEWPEFYDWLREKGR